MSYGMGWRSDQSYDGLVAVRTRGELVRLYAGHKSIPLDENGQPNPIDIAAAQLRVQCAEDRRRIMRGFRFWLQEGLRR